MSFCLHGCKFLKLDSDCNSVCSLTNEEPKFFCGDYDGTFECDKFEQAQDCLTCRHATSTFYEEDEIAEYVCAFKEGDIVYTDDFPFDMHHSDVPVCDCGKWELTLDNGLKEEFR